MPFIWLACMNIIPFIWPVCMNIKPSIWPVCMNIVSIILAAWMNIMLNILPACLVIKHTCWSQQWLVNFIHPVYMSVCYWANCHGSLVFTHCCRSTNSTFWLWACIGHISHKVFMVHWICITGHHHGALNVYILYRQTLLCWIWSHQYSQANSYHEQT